MTGDVKATGRHQVCPPGWTSRGERQFQLGTKRAVLWWSSRTWDQVRFIVFPERGGLTTGGTLLVLVIFFCVRKSSEVRKVKETLTLICDVRTVSLIV